MEGTKARLLIPLQDPNQTQTALDDPQKADVLANYYKLKIDLPTPLPRSPADLNQVINSAIVIVKAHGIGGKVLEWIRGWLTSREQSVQLNEK